ncbi:FkbM family methyltransferase [Dyadobacter psychrotolerans]|uniref:FkbM family methyltransferase n=1 Tax=Dyadobacter psychrotolerans TaxID=2541721 RepID=A0A4R5DVX1_9BACT|nr:FkbM family methyltransferase [Dyadobacter psychrotolerans]TDE18619.1 FkbM family methyltransferase [Dyadobacter psychrotolerans]
MIRVLKNKVWDVFNVIGIGAVLQLVLTGALKDYGWFRSYNSRQSVDGDGNPLPWYTYSFIFFLKPRLKPHFEVFEYGSGNSTRWYAGIVKHVTAVEHDTNWISLITPKLPKNTTVMSRPVGETYINAVQTENKFYHIVVVDGRNRVKCTTAAVECLTEDGVLILDNSEREWYQKAKDLMHSKGFKQLDFRGALPIISSESCSTVFYREGNCLGI